MNFALKEAVTSLLNFIDNRVIVRRVVLFFTLYLTWECYRWASEFATYTTRTGLDVAAIVAAVTAPVSALQGWAFKVYSDTKP